MKSSNLRSGLWSLLLSGLLGACALSGPLREDAKARGYRFQAPPSSSWETLKDRADADHAWLHRRTGATLALRSVCHRYEHISVQALSQNLINTVQDPEIESQESVQLDGRAAVSTLFRGQIDGVAVQSRLVVMRKDHCIFDFNLSQLAALGEDVRSDFDAFLKSFRYEGSQAP